MNNPGPTPIPVGLDVKGFPPTEAAVIGAILISPLEKARQLLASYRASDLTEPRLQVVDKIARYLVSEKVAPSISTVAAAAEHTGSIAQDHLMAFWVILYDLVDVNIVPSIHVGETMTRQLVRAAVRRTIATAGQRLTNAAATGDLPTMTAIAGSEMQSMRAALARLNPTHLAGDQEAAA